MNLMTVDLKPFMANGELERYGEEMADWIASNSDFAKENKSVYEALKESVSESQFVAASVEMSKQQAQAFVSLLAELCFNDFDYFSDSGQLGTLVRIFMDSERMDEIAALHKYGQSLQTDINIHDVDFA